MNKKNSKMKSFYDDQIYFFNDGSQNFPRYQPILDTFTMPTSLAETIVAMQSKGLPNGKTRRSTTSNNSLFPKLMRHNLKIRVKFKGSCLKQNGPIKRIDDSSITAEVKYFINFTESGKRYVLNLL